MFTASKTLKELNQKKIPHEKYVCPILTNMCPNKFRSIIFLYYIEIK